ncbi:MAG: hypothetical protein ABIV25_06075, partial [Paracoccaceae bacterium]
MTPALFHSGRPFGAVRAVSRKTAIGGVLIAGCTLAAVAFWLGPRTNPPALPPTVTIPAGNFIYRAA